MEADAYRILTEISHSLNTAGLRLNDVMEYLVKGKERLEVAKALIALEGASKRLEEMIKSDHP